MNQSKVSEMHFLKIWTIPRALKSCLLSLLKLCEAKGIASKNPSFFLVMYDF